MTGPGRSGSAPDAAPSETHSRRSGGRAGTQGRRPGGRAGTQGRPSGGRAPWWRLAIAVLLAVTGILLSSVAWNALRSAERERIQAALETTAVELALSFGAGFLQQLEHLRELGSNWGRSGTEDVVRWQAEANLFRKLHADCLALEWDSRKLPAPSLTSGTPEALALLSTRRADTEAESARLNAIESATETSLGPWMGPDGEFLVEIVIPIQVDQDQVGSLTALTDPAVALDRMAGARDEQLALEVLDGRISLFRRGVSAGGELSTLMEARNFRAGSLGNEWTVEVRPGRRLIASPQRLLQWMVLIGGIVLSVLIATTFWVGQVAMLRTRELLGATLELEEHRRELQRASEQARKQDERITAAREERRALMMSMEAGRNARAAGQTMDSALSELETFTYSVSHDLRSPMGAILNYVSVLTEDYQDVLGAEGKEYLGRISASARKAIAMMDGLLAFSRVGSQELKMTEIDVARMVREIHEELCESRPGKRPALSMGELPAVQGDPTLLWTLFSNLLSNAFKFTRDVEEPRVQVGGYLQGTDIVLYVEDNGMGFDMRHAGKLFGVFERLPSGEKHEGHGVGLAIVQLIVRRHGGSVRAEGVPDKGATFFVTLPSDPLHPESSDAPPTPPAA